MDQRAVIHSPHQLLGAFPVHLGFKKRHIFPHPKGVATRQISEQSNILSVASSTRIQDFPILKMEDPGGHDCILGGGHHLGEDFRGQSRLGASYRSWILF